MIKNKQPIIKHPDVIAFENWENSEEGKKCLEGEARGQYLRNRLIRAFYAGRRDVTK